MVNIHSTQHLYKLDNVLGYNAADERNWPPYEYFLRDKLARYLSVCPWNFVPGWSKIERSAELGLKVNLYDPDIHWNTKEGYVSTHNLLLGKICQTRSKGSPTETTLDAICLLWLRYFPQRHNDEVQQGLQGRCAR